MLKRDQVVIQLTKVGFPNCPRCCMVERSVSFGRPMYTCSVALDNSFDCREGHFKRLLHAPNKLVASRNRREGHYLGKAKNAEWWRGNSMSLLPQLHRSTADVGQYEPARFDKT